MPKRVDDNHSEMTERKRLASIANMEKANAANRARHATRNRASIVCIQCGATVYCKPREVNLKSYCSRACENQHYKERMKGSANPNYRGAGQRTCQQCAATFQSYNKSRKFCSKQCYDLKYKTDPLLREARARKLSLVGKRPRKPRKRKPITEYPLCPMCGVSRLPNGKVRTKTCGSRECIAKANRIFWESSNPRTSHIPTHTCIQCSKKFQRYGTARLYCSYQCFVADGGPFRAGMAASKMSKQYGAKKDANHKEIFEAMRALGVGVYDLSQLGGGVPDGIAWIAQGWRFFEVKNPKTGYGRRGLNPIQKKWLSQWKGGPVYIVRSVDQAIVFARGGLDQTECITPEQCAVELLKAG